MIERYIFNGKQDIVSKDTLTDFIQNFENIGQMVGDGRRNKVKIVPVSTSKIVIKEFKLPTFINQIAYRFFRKSKARRSFEYANYLQSVGIKTPEPVAFIDRYNLLFYKYGYYICEYLPHDLSFRELINDRNMPEWEAILRAFTRFTFQLHENNVNFLDHSPGNTLINLHGNSRFEFYLIDLNRMKFMPMDFDARMKNFAKLSPKGEMLQIMSNEYAKLYCQQNESAITERMSYFSRKFSTKYKRKEKLKARYFFWRKKKL